jgi:P-type Cu2+ transporter
MSSNAQTAPLDDRRPAALPPVAPLKPQQVAGLNDPAILRQCQVGPVTTSGAVPIGLGLSGMYCAACALTIESAIRAVPGVSEVQVQGATQRARLHIDPQRVKLADLVAAIRSVGYQAWPDGSALAQNVRQHAQRQLVWRLSVAAFCMMQVMMISTAQYVAGPDEIPPDIWRLLNWGSWVLSLPVMAFSCGPFFSGAWAALRQGRMAMDTPVAIGIVAMFVVSTGVTMGQTAWFGEDVYFDSLTMFVSFLLCGRWLEARARERVTRSLEALCNRLPESVERSQAAADVPDAELHAHGVQSVALSALQPGDRVRVAAGQAFPGDGLVVWGHTEADESMLTGECRPVPKQVGHLLVAGSLNVGSPVWCRIERLGVDTRYQQIVDLVHQALTERPGWLRTADRFAGPFLYAVIALALLGALAWQWIDPSKSVWVAVSVLVVTCPCAFSLAAPSALLAAAGALARQGVLVRRLEAVETLASVSQVWFDKTGTLTESALTPQQLWFNGQVLPVEQPRAPALHALLRSARSLAALSAHPVAQSLVAGFAEEHPEGAAVAVMNWHEVVESPGLGLQALDPAGHVWRLGSASWVLSAAEGGAEASHPGLAWPQGRVWVARWPAGEGVSGRPVEVLGVAMDEKTREAAMPALDGLRALGLQVAVLSGDLKERVVAFAQRLSGSPPVWVAGAAVGPEGKLQALQRAQSEKQVVAVVGDGINDAPVLAQAHVSFALDQGAPLAQAQADFIVLGGRLAGVPVAVSTARQALRIVRQNLAWAAAYNFVCIPLALMGYLPPWLAGIGMALSSLGVMLNALRLNRFASPDTR